MNSKIFVIAVILAVVIACHATGRTNSSRAISSAGSDTLNQVADKGQWSRDSYQPDASTYYGSYSDYGSYQKGSSGYSGGHSGNYGSYGPSESYGWVQETTGPSYKYKYHVYPHKGHSDNNKGQQKGKGGGQGWGWNDDKHEEDSSIGGDIVGAIGGVLGVGSAVVVACFAVAAILLLLAPLLLLIPKPYIAFNGGPDATGQNTTVLWKIGRGFPQQLERLQIDLQSGSLQEKINALAKDGKRVLEGLVTEVNRRSNNEECMERMSCAVKSYVGNPLAQALLLRVVRSLPSALSRPKAKFERGWNKDGNCELFSCPPN